MTLGLTLGLLCIVVASPPPTHLWACPEEKSLSLSALGISDLPNEVAA